MPTTQTLLWFLACAFVLHEVEEWELVGWLTANFEPAPHFDDRAARTLLLLFAFLGFSLTALSLRLLRPRVALFVLLPLFVGVLLGNALTHLFWLFHFQAYVPGVLTATLLIVPGTVLLIQRVLRERLVPSSYVWLLLAFALLQPIGAAAMGSRLWGSQLALQDFGARLAGWVYGAN